MKKQFKMIQLVQLSLLAAVAYVLMFFAFPIIPFAPFLKLDLSDLPILIGTILFGPLAGILIVIIKLLLYWITFGASLPSLIGLLASFASSFVLILTFYYGLKQHNSSLSMKRSISVVVVATLLLTLILSFLNWIIITPLYINLIGLKIGMPVIKYVLLFIVPFNLVKGFIIGTLFLIIQQQILKRLM